MTNDRAEYLLTNAELETGERFAGLDAVFDPMTRSHLMRLGLTKGLRCLEVGAGSGSIARWMADQVGPAGRVLAIDLDPRWCGPDRPTHMEVRALDVVTESIPVGPWDVIHERLVLQHIPERLDVLARLVDALAPGGLLLIEDFDTGEVRTVDRAGPNQDVVVRVARAFNGALRTRGGATDFAANALRTLRDLGLTDTGASGHVSIGYGGSGWAAVQAANALQVRTELIGEGITSQEVDLFLQVMADPDTVVGSGVLISSWGWRRQSAAPTGA